MSQSEKALYYNELKAAGVQFDKHYREYNTAELREAVETLRAQQPAPEPQAPQFDAAATAAAMRAALDPPTHETVRQPSPFVRALEQVNEHVRRELGDQRAEQAGFKKPIPRSGPNPNEMAGQRQNTQAEDEPIRVDEFGRVWYQEEVRKPAYPKPRGRRVLKYMDTGVREMKARNGEFVESFEVAGEGVARPAEVKITLPSYQVGIYKDPRFPFRIHIYNERMGFDLFEVQAYYGGAELVPAEIKKTYVENVLCYDIRTTVRAIQTEYRNLQLQGKV